MQHDNDMVVSVRQHLILLSQERIRENKRQDGVEKFYREKEFVYHVVQKEE